jgi:hypothetical protein
MKRAIAFVLTVFAALPSIAQTETSIEPLSSKKFNHQVGVQINELIRQIFNFNNSNSVNTNPYLLTYSLNHVRTGYGVRLGVGYNYQAFTNDDGISRRTTDLDDLRTRFGVEKCFVLSPKWSAGVGLDAVYNLNNNYTKSTIRGFDTVTTTTTSKISSLGGGPMVWLRYHITSRILIGTESSYYYTTGTQSDNIIITRRVFNGTPGGQLESSTTTVDDSRKEGRLAVPVAFFLIVQF